MRKANSSKLTKSQLLEHIESLESDLLEAKRDLEYMSDNYYSEDTLQDLIDDAIQEHERERYSQLQRYDAETHRQRFQLIHGGAA